jgi:hypothetical protein
MLKLGNSNIKKNLVCIIWLLQNLFTILAYIYIYIVNKQLWWTVCGEILMGAPSIGNTFHLLQLNYEGFSML